MVDNIYSTFDLHGHTNCGLLQEYITYGPTDVVLRAIDIGLGGVAITDHDSLSGIDEALNVAAKSNSVLIPGVEITSGLPDRTPHILALGITPDRVKNDRIPTYESPQDVMFWIRDHGGLVVIPHSRKYGGLISLSYQEIIELRQIIDGVEVSFREGTDPMLEFLAIEQQLARIGGSDFHTLNAIGKVRTVICGRPKNYGDVLDAIRKAATETVVTM